MKKIKNKDIEPYYQNRAKEVVDMLFNGKLFKDKITRDNLNAIEDLIAYLFQSDAKSARKCAEIMLRMPKD